MTNKQRKKLLHASLMIAKRITKVTMTNEQRKKLLPFIVGSPLCEVDIEKNHGETIDGYKIIDNKNESFIVYSDGSLSAAEPKRTTKQMDTILLAIATEHLANIPLHG